MDAETDIIRRLAAGEDPWVIDPEHGCTNPLTGYFPSREVELYKQDRFFHRSMPRDDRYEAGRALYHEWCGSTVSDRARYFDSMNPADKEHWMNLAERYALLEVKLYDRLGTPVKLLREAARVELLQTEPQPGHLPRKTGMRVSVNEGRLDHSA